VGGQTLYKKKEKKTFSVGRALFGGVYSNVKGGKHRSERVLVKRGWLGSRSSTTHGGVWKKKTITGGPSFDASKLLTKEEVEKGVHCWHWCL